MDRAVLRTLYANGWGLCAIADFMVCAKKTIRDHGAAMGLTWADARFPKGNVPFNKGVKGWQAGGRAATTQFKKGVRQGVAVKLYQPIGAERVSKDGYLERKVNDDLPLQARWRGVHRIVWEAAHGPIPPGHAVAFLPGKHTADAARITVDCLELVSRAELMRRNSYLTRYPKEVADLIRLRGALNRKINNRSKA